MGGESVGTRDFPLPQKELGDAPCLPGRPGFRSEGGSPLQPGFSHARLISPKPIRLSSEERMQQARRTTEPFERIDLDEAKKRIESGEVAGIDVREAAEFPGGPRRG